MAKIMVMGADLRPGDRTTGYTVLKVWTATQAEARLWKSEGLRAGMPCARVRFIEGDESDRWYPVVGTPFEVERDDA